MFIRFFSFFYRFRFVPSLAAFAGRTDGLSPEAVVGTGYAIDSKVPLHLSSCFVSTIVVKINDTVPGVF